MIIGHRIWHFQEKHNYKVSYSHFSFNWKQGSGKFPMPDPDWMPVIIFILCWFVSTPSTFYIVFDMINWKRQNWTKTGQELWLLKTLLYKRPINQPGSGTISSGDESSAGAGQYHLSFKSTLKRIFFKSGEFWWGRETSVVSFWKLGLMNVLN